MGTLSVAFYCQFPKTFSVGFCLVVRPFPLCVSRGFGVGPYADGPHYWVRLICVVLLRASALSLYIVVIVVVRLKRLLSWEFALVRLWCLVGRELFRRLTCCLLFRVVDFLWAGLPVSVRRLLGPQRFDPFSRSVFRSRRWLSRRVVGRFAC